MSKRGVALIVAVASLAFFAAWFNQYVPPTSYGELAVIPNGKWELLPYRDYFYQAPPGMPMLTRMLAAIAGPRVLALALFGVLLRTAATVSLYALLLRVARPWCAAVGALTALFVSSVDVSDTPFYYNHVAISLIVLGVHLGASGLAARGWRDDLRSLGSGALIVFAVACKQTMAFGALGAAIALFLIDRPAKLWRSLAATIAGAMLTVGGVAFWLWSHGLTAAFFRVLRAAPEGKGGIGHSLLRPFNLTSLYMEAAVTIAALLVLLGCFAFRVLRHRVRGGALLLLAMPAITWIGLRMGRWDGRALTLFLTALGFWGGLILAVFSLRNERPRAALGVLAFGTGYSCAVSWPLFENMAFPGLGVVFAIGLEVTSRDHRELRSALVTVAVAAALLVGHRKQSVPHLWGLWNEPAIETTRPSKHPVLLGMYTSPYAEQLYDAIAGVAATTAPDDRMYVYPNLAILYAIAGRRPATYGIAHWIDTCPDFLGKEDAARLLAAPPKLMVIRRDPEQVVANGEKVYRQGRRSSIRDVLAALEKLEIHYDSVGTFRAPNVTAPIEVLIRRN